MLLVTFILEYELSKHLVRRVIEFLQSGIQNDCSEGITVLLDKLLPLIDVTACISKIELL